MMCHSTVLLIVLIISAVRYVPAIHDALVKTGSPLAISDNKIIMMGAAGVVAVCCLHDEESIRLQVY